MFGLILIFLLGGERGAFAVEARVLRCARQLLSHTDDADRTREAMTTLHMFRARQFGDVEDKSSGDFLRADSTSSLSQRGRASGRIAELLAEYRANARDPDEMFTAYVIEGSDAIEAHFQAQEKLRQTLRLISRDWRTNEALFQSLKLFVAGIETIGFGYSIEILNPLLFLLTAHARNIPEEAIRGLRSWAYSQSPEEYLQSKRGTWAISASDQAMPLRLMRSLWRQRQLFGWEVKLMNHWMSYPHWTYALTSQKFVSHKLDLEVAKEPSGWVRSDEIRIESNPPKLIRVLRLVREKTPAPATEAAGSQLNILIDQTSPP